MVWFRSFQDFEGFVWMLLSQEGLDMAFVPRDAEKSIGMQELRYLTYTENDNDF